MYEPEKTTDLDIMWLDDPIIMDQFPNFRFNLIVMPDLDMDNPEFNFIHLN